MLEEEYEDYESSPEFIVNLLEQDKNELYHYGTKRHSGRYPWGSGDSPYQHSADFLGRVEELKSKGWKETPLNIKEEFGLSTTEYRTACSLAKSERRAETVARIEKLKEKGYSNSAIGRELGINESSVRSYLDENAKARTFAAKETADFLRSQIDQKGIIDVGKGVEVELNVSPQRLEQAIYVLEMEGYKRSAVVYHRQPTRERKLQSRLLHFPIRKTALFISIRN